MEVLIEKPYIEENDKCTRVVANIKGLEKEYKIWYEVDNSYKEFLCTERVDAFIVGLLPLFMTYSNNENPLVVKSETLMSEQLYYQLVSHYIPTLIKETDRYFNIKINCPLTKEKLPSYGAVGSGFSGGVDSTYTIINNRLRDPNGFKITHAAYFDYDPKGNFYGELQCAHRKHANSLAKSLDVEFVNIKSNLCESVYKMAHEAIISSMLFSYIIALQKLFSIYHVSSTHPYSLFKILGYSQERFQLLNVHCFSNENLRFYTPGSEAKRYEKTHFISNYDWPKKYLMVCMAPKLVDGNFVNCSKCAKCTKTMIDLDVYGKLDEFNDIFDVDYYRNNKNYYWGYLVFKGKQDPFIEETFEMFKKFGIKIPLSTYFSGLKKYIKNDFKRGNPMQYKYKP